MDAYLKIKLTNFKTGEENSFTAITYDIEKGLYKFYLSHTEIKFVPYYDFYLDIVYPVEQKFEKPDGTEI